MKIRSITNQNRRDFTAIYECEHCGSFETGSGYDDTDFHQNIIPAKKCNRCGKTAGDDYRARAPKYPDGMAV